MTELLNWISNNPFTAIFIIFLLVNWTPVSVRVKKSDD